MKQKPFGTLSLLLLPILVTAGALVFDESIYGVNAHPADWLGFAPVAPFRSQGLSWLLSAFLHLNFTHLATNLFVLFPIGMLIERKNGPLHLLGLSLLLHLMVLVSLMLWQHFSSLEGKAFLGSSHFILGLYTYWGISQRRWNFILLPVGVIIWGLWQNQGPLIHLAHAFGLINGILLGMGRELWSKFRPKSSD